MESDSELLSPCSSNGGNIGDTPRPGDATNRHLLIYPTKFQGNSCWQTGFAQDKGCRMCEFTLKDLCMETLVRHYLTHYHKTDPSLASCPPAITSAVADILHSRGYVFPELLERNKSRKVCNLSEARIGQVDSGVLETIGKLEFLTALRFSSPCPATSDDFCAMFSFGALQHLEIFHLTKTAAMNDRVLRIVGNNCGKLTELDISYSDVSDVGFIEIIPKKFPCLKRIGFSGIKVSTDAVLSLTASDSIIINTLEEVVAKGIPQLKYEEVEAMFRPCMNLKELKVDSVWSTADEHENPSDERLMRREPVRNIEYFIFCPFEGKRATRRTPKK